jgi:Cysteine-rich secretory protein family
MKTTSRLSRQEARNTVGVGAVVLALTGVLLGAPAIASADPDPAVLDLINQQRRQAGCNPVTQNPQLQAAADRHAKDLATNGYTPGKGHTGSDGSTIGQRVTATGYKWSAVDEIMAPRHSSAQEAVTGWLGSPPHKEAMLTCAYTDGGAASSGGMYVALFATPSGRQAPAAPQQAPAEKPGAPVQDEPLCTEITDAGDIRNVTCP